MSSPSSALQHAAGSTRALWLGAAWGAEAATALSLAGLSGPWLPAAAGAHLLAALAAALAFRRARADEPFLAFALVLSMPIVGVVGLSAVKLAARLVPGRGLYSGIHAEMAALPGPERSPESLERVFEWIQKQLSVQPLADVIRGGDPKTQRWAVELLERRADGAAVELLREAVHGEDRDIQIAASTALLRVEERLTAQIARARQVARRVEASAAAWIALGNACRAYQASRLLEPVMERHWLSEAEAAYGRALEREPASRGATLALAHVLLALDRLDEAEALGRRALAGGASTEADLVVAEALFRRGRWGDLRELSRAAVSAGRRDDLLLWWSGEHPDEPAPAPAPPR